MVCSLDVFTIKSQYQNYNDPSTICHRYGTFTLSQNIFVLHCMYHAGLCSIYLYKTPEGAALDGATLATMLTLLEANHNISDSNGVKMILALSAFGHFEVRTNDP